MALTFADGLKKLGLSDAAFGARCTPAIHRTQIWAYRTRRARPRADNAASILAVFADAGVELTLEDLLRAPVKSRSTRTNRRSKAA